MKINYAMFGTGLTGGHRTFFEISNQLVERGHDVTITTLGYPMVSKWFKPKAKVVYVEKYALIRKIIQDILAKKLGKTGKKINGLVLDNLIKTLADAIPECDINVATLCYSAFSVFRSNKGIPFYHMQHYEPLFSADDYGRKMTEETYYLPLNHIVNSSWLKAKLIETHKLQHLPVVNHAIDHDIFYPRAEKNKNGKYKIVGLGKPVDWKGIYEVCQAIKLVLEKRNDVEFILFGRAKLPACFNDVPHTFIASPSDVELAKLYSESDLVISASWYESFPLPPLEGMACNTAVITTPYGTEDYAFNEKNALVVPPKNPAAIAEAIFRLLDDRGLRERLATEGVKTAQQFTWEKTTDRVEALFKEAVQNG